MTTKPHHTTTKRRHSAADNHATRQQQLRQLERDLRNELAGLYDGPDNYSAPLRPVPFKPVVRWSVRRPDGGLPFLFEYRGARGCWRSVLEADAKKAIIKAGLVPHAHLETQMEA